MYYILFTNLTIILVFILISATSLMILFEKMLPLLFRIPMGLLTFCLGLFALRFWI